MQFKCIKCKQNKNYNDFSRRSDRKIGIRYICKICKRIEYKKYYYIYKNKEKIKEIGKRYYQKNLKKIKKRRLKWYKNNTEKERKRSRIWMKNNREKVNKYCNNRRKTNIHFRLKCNISHLITDRLKHRLSSKNGKSTFAFLPYTVDDLIKHLESLFAPWMNWQNYGKQPGYWCIDHIYPDSKFNYKSVDDEEFQKCWALNNLQPLEWMENIKKSNKI